MFTLALEVPILQQALGGVEVTLTPGRYLNVGDGIEVLEQVVSLDIGAPKGGLEKPQPKVGEGKEVPQSLHTFHASVQAVHVL